jgi:hypothetical protein
MFIAVNFYDSKEKNSLIFYHSDITMLIVGLGLFKFVCMWYVCVFVIYASYIHFFENQYIIID